MRVGYEVFHHDVAALVRFYVDVLGFEPLPSAQEEIFVVVRRDIVRVGCTFHEDASPGPADRPPPTGSEIVLRVEDVDAEYAQVVRSGWPVANALREQTWGLRDFRLFDPSGQYLRVTEDVPRSPVRGGAEFSI